MRKKNGKKMAENVTVYALDACALIAYLREEEGNDRLTTFNIEFYLNVCGVIMILTLMSGGKG